MIKSPAAGFGVLIILSGFLVASGPTAQPFVSDADLRHHAHHVGPAHGPAGVVAEADAGNGVRKENSRPGRSQAKRERHEMGRKNAAAGENSRDCTPDRREGSKPHLNIGTLGQGGGGSAVLTSAITYVLAAICQAEFAPVDVLRNPPEDNRRGITIRTSIVEYETDTRHYAHADSPSSSDDVKNLITGAVPMDGAILVVSAGDGPTPELRVVVQLARSAGVSNIVLYVDLDGTGQDQAAATEIEVVEILAENGFETGTFPVIRGSARAALEDRDPDIGINSILRLLEAMDREFTLPVRQINRPFLMPIEDVFSILDRGTVVTGRVERGIVRLGEEVEIVGIRDTQTSTVASIEMFHKLLDQGEAGDNVGVILRGIDRNEVQRGQVLAEPGSIAAHARFSAAVFTLTAEEGGRETAFHTNYRPQFYFRTADVTGLARLPEGTEMVRPGESTTMIVELIAPVAIEEGMRFAIREGGRTIGAGIVTRTGD